MGKPLIAFICLMSLQLTRAQLPSVAGLCFCRKGKSIYMPEVDCKFESSPYGKLCEETGKQVVSYYNDTRRKTIRDFKLLDIRGNDIDSVPGGFFNPLTGLVKLDVSYNLIEQIPDDMFKNKHRLETLIMHHNEMWEIPENFFASSPNNLRYLDLSLNKLEELTKNTFPRLPKLETLLLSGNKLEELPKKVFAKLSSLKVLKLWGNQITYIPSRAFWKLANLEELDLASNGIKEFASQTKVFSKNSKLRILNLEMNEIATLQDSIFRNLVSLEELRLSRNKITSISPGLLRAQMGLVNLQISGNRLDNVYAIMKCSNICDREKMKVCYAQAVGINECRRKKLVVLQKTNSDDE